MSVGNMRLFEGLIPASETTVFTNTTGRVVEINEVIVANNTGTAAVFSLSVVPSGGTAGNLNRLANGLSVAANASVPLQWEAVLLPGDFISMIQTTASALTVDITGSIVAS